jgi:hypothetical protein
MILIRGIALVPVIFYLLYQWYQARKKMPDDFPQFPTQIEIAQCVSPVFSCRFFSPVFPFASTSPGLAVRVDFFVWSLKFYIILPLLGSFLLRRFFTRQDCQPAHDIVPKQFVW